jgi:serine protease Do
MKKTLITLTAAIAISSFAFAQEEKKSTESKTETSEIIIRKDGEKETKITVQIDGDNIMVNGKPMVEFNDDGVKILKRKMMITEGSPLMFDGNFDLDGSFNDVQEKTDSVAFLGVSTEKTEKGAKVISISKESPAEKAGLLENDIITKLNNQKVEDPESLYKAVTANKPNDEVKITFLRDGKEKKTKATLKLNVQKKRKVIVMNNVSGKSRYGRPGFPPPPPPPPPPFGDDEEIRIEGNVIMEGPEVEGMPFRFNSFPPKQKLGVKIQDTEEGNGVKVIDVAENSVAEKAGVLKDDIVTEISGQKINNTDDIRALLGEDEKRESFKIKVLRNGKALEFDVKPPKKLKTMSL